MGKDRRVVILVCDDKPRMRAMYTKALSKIENVEVMTADHPEQVTSLLASNSKIGVLLMDLEFPAKPGGRNMAIIGHRFLPQIRKDFPHLKIVVVTQLGPAVYSVVLECESKHLHDAWIDVGKDFKEEEIVARVQPLVYPLGLISRDGSGSCNCLTCILENQSRSAFGDWPSQEHCTKPSKQICG